MSDGQLVADHITVVPEPEMVQFEGMVQAIASDRWTVAGQVVLWSMGPPSSKVPL